jgi:hypothetical protein
MLGALEPEAKAGAGLAESYARHARRSPARGTRALVGPPRSARATSAILYRRAKQPGTMRSALLTSFFLTCVAHGQDLRPLTRVGPKSTLVVAEAQELFPAIERGERVYTAVLRGAVRHDTVQRYVRCAPVIGTAACQLHLAAKLDRPVEPGTVYLPGTVSDLRPFMPEKRRIYFWGTDTLDPVLPSEGRSLRCIWRPDGYGDRVLLVQEFDAQESVRTERLYHIRRSTCAASQCDSIAVVRCPPDYRHAGTEPVFVLALVNGQLVQVWREPADAPGRELLAVRDHAGRRALVFSTGDVLQQKRHGWSLESPEAVDHAPRLAQQR